MPRTRRDSVAVRKLRQRQARVNRTQQIIERGSSVVERYPRSIRTEALARVLRTKWGIKSDSNIFLAKLEKDLAADLAAARAKGTPKQVAYAKEDLTAFKKYLRSIGLNPEQLSIRKQKLFTNAARKKP